MPYLGLGGNDLGFTNSLALSSHGKRLLQFLAEDDVLDQHALDGDTPTGGYVLNDLADGLRNLLTTLDDILQDSGADNMSQSSLGALHEGLANIVDAESGLVRSNDVVVDDGREAQSNVVLGHADLLRDLSGLNLDIDLDQTLAEGVYLDETRVDGLVETTELGDETDITLLDILVRVGADDAAGDGAHGSDDGAEGVDCGLFIVRFDFYCVEEKAKN